MQDIPQEATHDVLEKAYRLSLDKANHHVAENGTNGVEPLIGCADISQPRIIKQNLLNDEDGDRLGELTTSLHDAQAQRDYLGRQEEGDSRR